MARLVPAASPGLKERQEATDGLLDQLTSGAKAWVPALWHLELGNVLLGAQRRKWIDRAGIEQFLGALAFYDIEVDSETIPRAWSNTLSLAPHYRLTVYDVTYLELALRKGLPIATLDDARRKSMTKAGGKLAI